MIRSDSIKLEKMRRFVGVVALKLFNRSHKSKKKTRQNSAVPHSHRELFTHRISRFSDSRFLCCHLVEIKDVITPRKIILFKYKSRTERRMGSMRAKVSLFRGLKTIQNEVNNCGKVTLEGR